MLENIKTGDRVINSLGEEATVTRVLKYENGRTRLGFKSPITGWLYETPRYSWAYENNGKFVRDAHDRKASDIVKVVKHD